MGDSAKRSLLQGIFGSARTSTRYAEPFTYENISPTIQAMPTAASAIRSWKESFGVDGGCLDTGQVGIKINVSRSQGQTQRSSHSRRKITLNLASEHPIKESDNQIVAGPVVEIKQKRFSENDKMVVELPVVAKVKEDAESQSKAEFVVMRQNGPGKPIEEVPESDWTHCPETSQLRIEVRRSSLKSLFFAIIRCIEGKIWKYVQITVHLSVYGPPQLEPSMCLHAIFSCKSYSKVPPITLQPVTNWTDYQFEISKHQGVRLKVDVSSGRSGAKLWKIDHSKVDPIYKRNMQCQQVYIKRTILMTFDPGNKQQQMEQFMLSLTMFAEEDQREHHHCCSSPQPMQLDGSSAETASSVCSGRSSLTDLNRKKKDSHHKKDLKGRRRSFKQRHSACPASQPEMPISSLPVVQATKDFSKSETERRENLLNLKVGECALVLVPSILKARRQGKLLNWDIGISCNREIGFFPEEEVKQIKSDQTEVKCTGNDILVYGEKLCSSCHLQIDDDSIKTLLADRLRSKWFDLARAVKFSTVDIDAITTETDNEREQVIRLVERIKMEGGRRGYLPTLVCGLLTIGCKKLAIITVVNTLLYTVAKTTIGRWKEFERELVAIAKRENVELHVRKVAGSSGQDFDHALEVLKRGYLDNKTLFLECLKIALRDKKWKNADFTECEFLTEKVFIFHIICNHLCSCNLEDRQLY